MFGHFVICMFSGITSTKFIQLVKQPSNLGFLNFPNCLFLALKVRWMINSKMHCTVKCTHFCTNVTNQLNYHHFCFDTMCTVEGNLSLRPSLRKVDNLDEKKWSRHKTTEQPSRLTIGQHSQHTVNRAEKERRSEGCNFAVKIYPGYQVSIDHFEVCGRVV